jgi:hypothetical protein
MSFDSIQSNRGVVLLVHRKVKAMRLYRAI